jgi:DNA-binding Lrp family transcriptional regulator
MKKLKPIDYKLLYELMKDARRSDREIARILRVSQPTVTRRRGMLEKEVIDGYTAIPKWGELGFEIFSITFIKSNIRSAPMAEKKAVIEKGSDWVRKQPNIFLAGRGRGCGFDGFMMSFHKRYSDYSSMLAELQSHMGGVVQTESFILPLGTDSVIKPFHLKYLAETEKQRPS